MQDGSWADSAIQTPERYAKIFPYLILSYQGRIQDT